MLGERLVIACRESGLTDSLQAATGVVCAGGAKTLKLKILLNHGVAVFCVLLGNVFRFRQKKTVKVLGEVSLT